MVDAGNLGEQIHRQLEHDGYELDTLAVTRIVGTTGWKVDGTAWRHGKRFLIGGTDSQVRGFDPDSDPFGGL